MKSKLQNYPLIGIGTVIGGILTIVLTILIASQPVPPPGIYRDTEHLALWQGLTFLLMALGVWGTYLQQPSPSRLSQIGLYSAVLGALMAAIGDILASLYTTNLVLVPIFFAPGSLAMLLGFLLTGISRVKIHHSSAWSGWLLILGTLFGILTDENSPAAWFGIGLGVVWILVGWILLKNEKATGLVEI